MKRAEQTFRFAVPTLLLLGWMSPAHSQSNPTKEYVRLGGRVVAIENPPAPAPPWNLSPIAYTAAATGAFNSFQVLAPAGVSWTATSDQMWLKISKTASLYGTVPLTGTATETIYFSVDPQTGGAARTGKVTITGTFTDKIFDVSQSGVGAGFSGFVPTPPLVLTLDSAGSGNPLPTVSITSNLTDTSSTVTSNAGWLTVTAGQATGLGSRTVSFSYSANNAQGAVSRTGTLTLNAPGVTGNGLTVVFTQPPAVADWVEVSSAYTSGSTLASPMVSYPVTVTASGTWSVGTNSPSWITVAPTSGASGAQFTFTVAANYTASSRSGTITVTKGTASKVITVVQNMVQTITVLPDTTSGNPIQIYPGSTYQFHVALDGVPDDLVPAAFLSWSEDSPLASISSTGLLTAPNAEGQTARVYATFTPRGITNTNTSAVLAWSGIMPPVPVSVTWSQNTGTGATFATQVQFSNGAAEIGEVGLIFDNPTTQSYYSMNDCWLRTTTDLVPPPMVLSVPGAGGGHGDMGQSLPWGPSASVPGVCAASFLNASQTSVGQTRTVYTPVTFPGAPLGPRELVVQANSIWYGQFSRLSGHYIPMGTYTLVSSPTMTLVSPVTGLGSGSAFTTDYTYTDGISSLSTLDLLVGGATSNPLNTCLLRYKRASNTFHLMGNDGTTESTGYIPGAAGITLQNNQCAVAISGATVTPAPSGQTLRIVAPITFKPAFSGPRVTYTRALSTTGIDTGYQSKGNWTVDEIPSGVSINPASGSGVSQTFSFTFGDPNGYADITEMYGLIGASAATGCAVAYNPATNALSIMGTAGTITPGSGSLTNGRCTLTGSGSSAPAPAVGSTIRTVNVALTFSAGFAGSYTSYLFAKDAAGAESLSAFGSWITNQTADLPVFSPDGGLYTSIQTVTITSSGASAIYYTTDGSAPTTSSTLYTGPVAINVSTTLKAMALKAGLPNSPVKTATYTINLPAPFYSTGGTWNYRRKIVIDHNKVSTDLTNFAALISADTDSALAANARSDGFDILFTAANGLTKLDHELESYTSATGKIASWVRIPSLSSLVDTEIYMYYGNSSASNQQNKTGVWESGYVGVWHMAEGSGTTLGDSTTYANNASKLSATEPNPTAGRIANGQNYDGANDRVHVPADAEFNTSNFTLQFVANMQALAGGSLLRLLDTPTTFSKRPIITYDSASSQSLVFAVAGTNYQTAAATFPYNQWNHVALTYDGTTPALYINGAPVSSPITYNWVLSQANTNTITIGTRQSQSATSKGIMDEVRMSNSVRSAGWMLTEYRNQSSPSTFFAIGSPEQGAVATPAFSPVQGTYASAQTVTITTATSGATIYYTTNGSTPTTSSTQYTAPVSVATNLTLKAIAVKAAVANSAVGQAIYGIQAATPTFSPVAGTYTGTQSVTVSTATSGATIYYTIDGSTPTTSSLLYSAPVSIAASATLKAIATKSGMTNSPEGSAVYTIQVATPTFSPVAGTYTSVQSVAISSATSGTTIYYTTDGSTPTTSSTQYSAAVSVGSTQTLKALAVKAGLTNSAIGSAAYTINLPAVATPTFNPVAGTYTSVQSVTISSTTSGATFYYTTDGSTPTTSSTQYSTAVSVGSTQTLKALAVKAGMTNSAIGSAAYTINLPAVATPTFSPVAGTYTSVQSVALSSTTSGATIYYTIDGSTPTTSSTQYSSAVNVAASLTLKALAVKAGMTNSAIGSAAYTINLPAVATPTFSPVAGNYSSTQSVTISTTTSGSTIYYTTDGSTPTTSSTQYTSAVSVATNLTLKALAVKAGMTNSAVGSAAYTIQVATPTFSPVAGTYTSVQSVTISSTTSGSTIYYTTDGSTPTTSSTQYTSAVSVGSSLTLKAIAVKAAMSNSAVGSAAYTINLPVAATPTFSPVAGAYTSTQSVTISTTTSGATIYYTTDGSTPTTSSTQYSSAVSVATNLTLKAIAVKAGLTNSAVGSSAYTIQVATPTFSPGAGSYGSAQSVTISSATSGTTIYYTTNGSTPTTSSTLYTGAVSVATSLTLKAIAVKANMTESGVGSAAYTISIPTVATPTFNPPAGSYYSSSRYVDISTSTSGATIYYTTNGTTPTTSSTLYTNSVNLPNSTPLKAIAVKAGMTNSAVASATNSQVTSYVTVNLGNFSYLVGSINVIVNGSWVGSASLQSGTGTYTINPMFGQPINQGADVTIEFVVYSYPYAPNVTSTTINGVTEAFYQMDYCDGDVTCVMYRNSSAQ